MTDLIKCRECGNLFNPAYLDQVMEHLHAGVEIDQTIKGERVMEEKKHLVCSVDMIDTMHVNADYCIEILLQGGRKIECVGEITFDKGDVWSEWKPNEINN